MDLYINKLIKMDKLNNIRMLIIIKWTLLHMVSIRAVKIFVIMSLVNKYDLKFYTHHFMKIIVMLISNDSLIIKETVR